MSTATFNVAGVVPDVADTVTHVQVGGLTLNDTAEPLLATETVALPVIGVWLGATTSDGTCETVRVTGTDTLLSADVIVTVPLFVDGAASPEGCTQTLTDPFVVPPAGETDSHDGDAAAV